MRHELIGGVVRALGAVRSRRVGVALGLWGEPGIGKTHAAAQVLREVACAGSRAQATCTPGELAAALPRLRQMPAWAARQLDRARAGEAAPPGALVASLAAALGSLAPFVLHLDDLHEADAERAALIGALAQAVTRTRGVGLLVTSRQAPPAPFVAHRLDPLDAPETAALLGRELGAPPPSEGLAWVQARTGGNPLYTLEFARYLARQGFLWSDGARWHWRPPPDDFLPVTLEALIGQLVAGAAPTQGARAVLEARALLPAQLADGGAAGGSQPLWAEVAGVDPAELRAAVQNFEAAGLLVRQDFAHPLYREVVARHLRPDRRRAVARRAVAALRGDPRAAAGFVDQADLPPDQALQVLSLAAQASRAAGQAAMAARHLAAGVRYAAGPARARLALEAAHALAGAGLPEALEYAELAATGGAEVATEAVVLCAELLAQRGQLTAAEQRLQSLPAAVSQERWWQLQIQIAARRGVFGEVLALWRSRPEWQPGAPVGVHKAVGSAHAYLGDADAAEAIVQGLLARPDLDPDELQQARNLLGQVLQLRRDWPRLLAAERETIALARAHPDATHLGLALMNHAATLNRAPDPDAPGTSRPHQAEIWALLSEASQIFARLGLGLHHATTLMRLAFEARADGQFEQAETLLAEAHAMIVQHDALLVLTESHLKQARLYLEWQPPHGPPLALRHARTALDLSRTTGDQRFLHNALCYSARAEARAGSHARALALAQEALALAGDHPERLANARFAHGLALEAGGRPEAARAQILSAVQLHLHQGDRAVAEQRGLELDRLGGDADSARRRRDWLLAAGEVGLAQVAPRYFPQLDAPHAAQPDPPASRLRVLGPVEVWHAGQPVRYRGRRRAELLAYLLEARLGGRAEVGALELLDTFYPEVPEAEARHTLTQQVYLIRSGLGPNSVLSTPLGYALGAVSSDAEEFLAGGDSGLWRGPYLDGLAEGWHPGVREALTLALRARVEALLTANAPEAARLGGILTRLEPYDPEALRLAVRALDAAGDRAGARGLYAAGRTRLLEVGEHLPASADEFVGGALAS